MERIWPGRSPRKASEHEEREVIASRAATLWYAHPGILRPGPQGQYYLPRMALWYTMPLPRRGQVLRNRKRLRRDRGLLGAAPPKKSFYRITTGAATTWSGHPAGRCGHPLRLQPQAGGARFWRGTGQPLLATGRVPDYSESGQAIDREMTAILDEGLISGPGPLSPSSASGWSGCCGPA